jgi:D-alanine-D-alanine ligase
VKRRIRVGLIFGGQSGEHEVSIASAESVLRSLDPEKYEAVGIGITRQGQWLIADSPERLLQSEVTLELPDTTEAVPDITHHGIVPVNDRGGIDLHETAVDVVFPLLHGPYGEDGTVQGLLELAGIPYVGSGVLASSVSMDKAMMKAVFEHYGLPGVAYRLVTSVAWARDPGAVMDMIEKKLAYPVFVKPCNLGSSVGISKAHDRKGLQDAINLAVRYDRRIIVEEGVDAREVECSVLGNDEPLVSVPGEIVPHHEFYDYEAKYTEGLSDLIVPARLSAEQAQRVQELARQAFIAVDASGLARVDFFVRKSDGEILVNELNTIPGFTTTSMYPRLWEATGVPFREIVDRLIQFAIDRHAERSQRSTER